MVLSTSKLFQKLAFKTQSGRRPFSRGDRYDSITECDPNAVKVYGRVAIRRTTSNSIRIIFCVAPIRQHNPQRNVFADLFLKGLLAYSQPSMLFIAPWYDYSAGPRKFIVLLGKKSQSIHPCPLVLLSFSYQNFPDYFERFFTEYSGSLLQTA